MGDDVLNLAVPGSGAQGHVDAAAAEDGKVRDEPVLVVLCKDGHVSAREAARCE